MANKSIVALMLFLSLIIVSSWERQERLFEQNNKHSAKHSESEGEEALDITPKLGCIWDQSGCAMGCDIESMNSRCSRLNHDQERCEGEEGKSIRCLWSHGVNAPPPPSQSAAGRPGQPGQAAMNENAPNPVVEAMDNGFEADGEGYLCVGPEDCDDDEICDQNLCKNAPRSKDSSSRDSRGSKPSSKSSSRDSSRSSRGGGSADGESKDSALRSDGDGYKCSNNFECGDHMICNDHGICELALGSRSHSQSGSSSRDSSRGSKSGGSSSRDSSPASKSGAKPSRSGTGSKSASYDHSRSSSHSAETEGVDQPKLGCVWNGDGCHDGCDPEAMSTRCHRLDHDQEGCEGELGAMDRCEWSHGANTNTNAVVQPEVEMEAMAGGRSSSRDSSPASKAGAKPSRSGSKSASNERSRSSSHSAESADVDSPKLGCVWNGDGCHDGCDPEAMSARCHRMDHDQESCEGELGAEDRCEWSHGANVVVLAEVEMEAMARGSSEESEPRPASREEEEVEEVPMGCVWDLSGCANGCDADLMQSRCKKMSHDQAMCEGEIGAFNRCKWSHGGNSHFNADVEFGDLREDSTVDILLIVAGVVTAVFAIQQIYRCSKNWEYKEIKASQHLDEIQITSHIV